LLGSQVATSGMAIRRTSTASSISMKGMADITTCPRVTLNGAFEALGVEIDPMTAVEERSVVEDLVAAAINDAVRRVEALQREKMGAVARGLGLPPGLNLPG